MKNYIKGNYRQTIFNSNNGYIIGLFKIKETNDENLQDFINKTITFTGYFADLTMDDTYLFYGELIEHPRYGTQYQVNEYERVKIEDKEGLVEFLSSDLFPKVGLKMAHRIVDTLGLDAIDKILEEPSILNIVPKIPKKTQEKIISILIDYEDSHKTIVYLTDLGFVMKDALAIYNKYKKNTINQLEFNIYDLIGQIDEITFSKIDGIRTKLKIEDFDDRRIKACIIYIMQKLIFANGDTYLYFDEILHGINMYLNENVEDQVIRLMKELG